MTVALIVALAAIPVGAAAVTTAADDVDDQTDANETDSITPGEQLSGVVGVQNAELDGDLSDRTFGIQIANASTDAAKAEIVDDRLAELKAQLEANDADLEELEEAREAGEISEGEYRSQVATAATETNNTERAAGQTANTTNELPEDVLADRGINVTAIQELRTNASELGGPETAEIARSIAGNASAVASEPGPPDTVPGNGTPADGAPGNGTPAEADDAGSDDTPADDAGSDDTPADDAGSDDTPADDAGSTGGSDDSASDDDSQSGGGPSNDNAGR